MTRDTHDDLLAAHGGALIAHAVATTSAPLTLRGRLQAQGLAARPAADPRRSARRRAAFLSAVAAATAAAVAAAALVLPGGSPGAPSISQAAELGTRPAQAPARVAAADPTKVAVQVQGTSFPTWRRFGWTPTGTRTDTLRGRPVKTVFYAAPDGTRVGYSIVGGKALEGTPQWGRAVRTERRDGRWIVTWQRDGKTCVLTAPDRFAVHRLELRAAGS
jgi:hypothetical protein